MRIILLSGGSGKRLWPLSNDARSKQFLKLLRNDAGRLESMVQRVWSQLKAAGLSESAVIATSPTQIDMIRSQIGQQVPIIAEPTRRDTFPAIALSVAYLHTVLQADRDEIVVVLPVDPYVDASFFEQVKRLAELLPESGAAIGLMGAVPTVPSTKYGYIVPDRDEPRKTRYYRVSHFMEKPDEATATKLLDMGALWNCGVFAFRLGYLLDAMERKGLPASYGMLRDVYPTLRKISFDYEVLEREKRLIVLPYDGDWKDLGTWNTLTEEMGSMVIGKHVKTHGCSNTHVINELTIPILVLGIDNAVVAASPDGILVTDKAVSPKLKDYLEDTREPMYEERRWGWFRVLDSRKQPDGQGAMTMLIALEEGQLLRYRRNLDRHEAWTVIKGKGILTLNGEQVVVEQGRTFEVAAGAGYALRAEEEMECICVQTGDFSIPNRWEALEEEWNELIVEGAID
ncbi:mannose-1-phosphate guanylyltransferase [Xylanibacillus composti]|uniref:Mannose-1-phosphate guanylyltransferase n=1 Tax=Xylanibacillus composti TaxID=1572762 RepID=A0A8J4M3D8_9BACL|nr:sugar phosphate nucleotidyltransferase [Xylanibacillus composti]MDT9723747.1 mannose-1-phosphate guanylyltransferase [Xylanibacillus composti]GIQ70785.1 mannose-1-phosphate guanylyltransferase [Xylanibacillus composti]